ncbi:MAG: tRNA uridine(34) 5-carboxymethylaminomethyl modification radical SAM/GNAT enzyme Elp3 [archaeon]
MVQLNNKGFRKPTKTLSGVTPIAVMLKPKACKTICDYCPSLKAPQSYTPESPAVLRAAQLNYDPYKQVKVRLKSFQVMQHPTSKIELIVMGGTFFNYSKKYRRDFIKSCYDSLNNKKSKSLDEAIRLNENAEHRCVALCIETRPDFCSLKNIKEMREYGATRCELGVQIIDDKVYKKVNRNHTVQDVVNAVKLLRESGFKIGMHIMPNLPGSSFENDLKCFERLFSDERFKPDQLKIYPCQVIKGSKLEFMYKDREYEPYTEKQLEEMLIKMLKMVPKYCRVMRVMRELPPSYLVKGTLRIDFRTILDKKVGKIDEIRSREVGLVSRYEQVDKNLKLDVYKYRASEGDEYFISMINKDNILFGLLRLRITKSPVIHNSNAIIREIHVYGKAFDNKDETWQHKGIGKILMDKAEEIARKYSKNISVISGIGVRNYFRDLGYKLENTYMVKSFK